MKINYDTKMKEIIGNFNGKKTLLLHVCCGPCSSNVIKELSEYFNITIYFSNSNIYPEEEYYRRKDELVSFVERFNKDYNQTVQVIEEQPKFKGYLKELSKLKDTPEGGQRCYRCYSMRMDNAYYYAKDNHFDYWTTVLSVSPHKNSEWINEIGASYHDNGTKFLYSDFKKNDGYKKSVEMADKYDLYRQSYCGCLYSYNEMLERNKK